MEAISGSPLEIEELAGIAEQPLTVDRRSGVLADASDAPLTLALSDSKLVDFLRIARRFGCEEYAYAVTPNVDHLIRYCDEASFRKLYRDARFVLLDSRFLARLVRVTTGTRLPVCPGSDLTAHLFKAVIEPDDVVVLIGGTSEKAQMLRGCYGLSQLRHYNPPMGFIKDPAAVEETLEFIEAQGPFRFCLLAVGCPQQEMLARALKTRGRAKGLALCVGSAVEFLTGGERRAPAWVGAIGLEWLFRLSQDPGRLAARYLIRGPRIFYLLPRLGFRIRSRRADQFRS
jgi:exopolysaccharide biosynthesis WecB/TagA/CpsF family protein